MLGVKLISKVVKEIFIHNFNRKHTFLNDSGATSHVFHDISLITKGTTTVIGVSGKNTKEKVGFHKMLDIRTIQTIRLSDYLK